MTRRVVGILGGMGPEATIVLQQRLLGLVAASDDADHVPLFIDMNPQVPSRIARLIEGTGEDPAPVLVRMAERLQDAGASALAMPCNTAHHYAASIEEAVSIPFLNMVDLSVAEAAGRLERGARVGLLASPAVRMAGVFEAPLRQAGLQPIWPADDAPMLAAIRSIKVQGPDATAKATLAAARAELLDQGAACLLVACSEFSMIADALPASPPLIDTIDVLARAIRDHSFGA